MMAGRSVTAFVGARRMASGEISEVVREVAARGVLDEVRLFDDQTGRIVEPDLSSVEPAVRKPGRPRLGVVAREITLLPRHWEWLGRQPGGASVALRRLVEDARRTSSDDDDRREARDAAYAFMAEMAGNEPGFEEASRALFAGDGERLKSLVSAWPSDIGDHLMRLAEPHVSAEMPSA